MEINNGPFDWLQIVTLIVLGDFGIRAILCHFPLIGLGNVMKSSFFL